MCERERPCYPVEAGGRCMTLPEQIALFAVTMALVALWLPFHWAGQAARKAWQR